MEYKTMNIDGAEWVIAFYPGMLGIQKDGVKKWVKVEDDSSYMWKLMKTKIKAKDGAEGLYKYIAHHYDEQFAMVFVKQILNHAFETMQAA